jgi:hypothetical protein
MPLWFSPEEIVNSGQQDAEAIITSPHKPSFLHRLVTGFFSESPSELNLLGRLSCGVAVVAMMQSGGNLVSSVKEKTYSMLRQTYNSNMVFSPAVTVLSVGEMMEARAKSECLRESLEACEQGDIPVRVLPRAPQLQP